MNNYTIIVIIIVIIIMIIITIIYIYIYIKDAIDLSRKLRIALPIRAIAFTLFSGT